MNGPKPPLSLAAMAAADHLVVYLHQIGAGAITVTQTGTIKVFVGSRPYEYSRADQERTLKRMDDREAFRG